MCKTVNNKREIPEVPEKILQQMAVDVLDITDNEEIVKQMILKRYDTEPYYIVNTYIKEKGSDDTLSFVFEYRIY